MTHRPFKPRLIRPSYFVWLLVPMAAMLVYSSYGLPHLRWSYAWVDEGQGYDPFAERYYTRCTYIGAFGAFTVHAPSQGRCAWFRFFKSEGGSQ